MFVRGIACNSILGSSWCHHSVTTYAADTLNIRRLAGRGRNTSCGQPSDSNSVVVGAPPKGGVVVTWVRCDRLGLLFGVQKLGSSALSMHTL
jgi:hypothetical protein